MNLCTSTRQLEWRVLDTEEACTEWGIDPMGSIGLVAVRDPNMPGTPMQAIMSQEQFEDQYDTI